MSAKLSDMYHRHAEVIDEGRYSQPTHAVMIEFAADGPRLMTFGLHEATARETLSVMCDAIQKLAGVASDYNAQASN